MKKKTLAKSYWKNKKFHGRQFQGNYYRVWNGQRVFELSNKNKTITFESWQMAKELGWKRKKTKAGRKG